jgi:hypothetical protein
LAVAKRSIAIVLAIVLLLAGCSTRGTLDPGFPVVSHISVICRQDGYTSEKVFTSQEKMRMILNALRTLGQQFSPSVDPEPLSARSYGVTVTMTDGSRRHYQTKGDCFIRTDENPWQQCDPKRLEKLNLLLQQLPGDQ